MTPESGPNFIYAYTRSQAIADGVLVDATEQAKAIGFKLHTAVTDHLFHGSVEVPEGLEGEGQSVASRLHDLMVLALSVGGMLADVRWSRKIGQPVKRIFESEPSPNGASRAKTWDGRARASPTQYLPAVPHPRAGQVDLVSSTEGRVGHESAPDAAWLPVSGGMDWHSRAVLSWRLSNTSGADCCVVALKEAMHRYGVPEIFNTDQGSQFTGQDFTQTLKDAGVAISMDGKGRWMDNVFIERLWRSVKWECVYLREFETGSQARQALGDWFHCYNEQRPHTAFDDRRPMDVYRESKKVPTAA